MLSPSCNEQEKLGISASVLYVSPLLLLPLGQNKKKKRKLLLPSPVCRLINHQKEFWQVEISANSSFNPKLASPGDRKIHMKIIIARSKIYRNIVMKPRSISQLTKDPEFS